MVLDKAFFHGNRLRLADDLKGGILVLTAYDVLQSSADMTHEFDYEANFFYISGLQKARWRLVYDSARDYLYLVRPDLSEVERVFNGYLDDKAAIAVSGADKVISSDEFEPLLKQLARQHDLVYALQPENSDASVVLNPAVKRLWRQLERVFHSISDVRLALARQRAIKQPQEIAMLKSAAALSIAAFQDIKQNLQGYHYEYEVEADFTAIFRRKNARHAYQPIIASGANAVTLHYIENSAKLAKNNLVLLDVGANVNAYASDITRTYAFGRATKRQTEVHAAVVQAQADIIELLRPGLTFREYQTSVDRIMYFALKSIGLAGSNEIETVRKYMPHAVSHGLGIDTHDSLGRVSELRPGMVLTVEPGIYISKENIGVRIEDDILVTDTGHQNLTAKLSTSL